MRYLWVVSVNLNGGVRAGKSSVLKRNREQARHSRADVWCHCFPVFPGPPELIKHLSIYPATQCMQSTSMALLLLQPPCQKPQIQGTASALIAQTTAGEHWNKNRGGWSQNVRFAWLSGLNANHQWCHSHWRPSLPWKLHPQRSDLPVHSDMPGIHWNLLSLKPWGLPCWRLPWGLSSQGWGLVQPQAFSSLTSLD